MKLSRLASTTVRNHTSPRPSTLAKRFETASKRTGWSITGPSRILHWLRNGRELHRRDCCTHSATPGHSIRKDLLSKSAPERHATSVARVRQDVCRFLHVLA